MCALQSAAVPGERRRRGPTPAGVREDDLVEDGGEERGGDVGERGDGRVRAAARGHAPDGHGHKARAYVTRGIGRDCKGGAVSIVRAEAEGGLATYPRRESNPIQRRRWAKGQRGALGAKEKYPLCKGDDPRRRDGRSAEVGGVHA